MWKNDIRCKYMFFVSTAKFSTQRVLIKYWASRKRVYWVHLIVNSWWNCYHFSKSTQIEIKLIRHDEALNVPRRWRLLEFLISPFNICVKGSSLAWLFTYVALTSVRCHVSWSVVLSWEVTYARADVESSWDGSLGSLWRNILYLQVLRHWDAQRLSFGWYRYLIRDWYCPN